MHSTKRLESKHLPDEEYARLQEALIRDPETGDLIPGSGAYARSGGR